MIGQTIKSVMNNLFTKSTIKSILFKNSECTDDKLVAEAFRIFGELRSRNNPNWIRSIFTYSIKI